MNLVCGLVLRKIKFDFDLSFESRSTSVWFS
jgi:hypothetical protein